MDIAEHILLKAIQKSLWNTNIEFPDDTDWDAVLEEAEKQAVLGVIANAIPTEVRQKNKGRFAAITAKYVRTLFAQTQVVQLMEKHQIPMAILKGSAAAIYYPVPSQRSMGDIDFYVQEELYAKANTALLEMGIGIYLKTKTNATRVTPRIKWNSRSIAILVIRIWILNRSLLRD